MYALLKLEKKFFPPNELVKLFYGYLQIFYLARLFQNL